jgi:hypothetical protein
VENNYGDGNFKGLEMCGKIDQRTDFLGGIIKQAKKIASDQRCRVIHGMVSL